MTHGRMRSVAFRFISWWRTNTDAWILYVRKAPDSVHSTLSDNNLKSFVGSSINCKFLFEVPIVGVWSLLFCTVSAIPAFRSRFVVVFSVGFPSVGLSCTFCMLFVTGKPYFQLDYSGVLYFTVTVLFYRPLPLLSPWCVLAACRQISHCHTWAELFICSRQEATVFVQSRICQILFMTQQ
jgi:hypothetical protein